MLLLSFGRIPVSKDQLPSTQRLLPRLLQHYIYTENADVLKGSVRCTGRSAMLLWHGFCLDHVTFPPSDLPISKTAACSQ